MKHKLSMIHATAIILAVFAFAAQAAQLTAGRDTPIRSGEKIAVAVAQNQHIYVGALVCVSNILAYEAADVTGYAVLGVAENEVDQTGDAYDATKKVTVRKCVARFVNGPTFTLADIGKFAYIYDDQTVTSAGVASADIPAGIIVDVDSSGVWIDIGSLNRALSGSFDDLVVADDGSIGDDLSVVGDLDSATLVVSGAATVGTTLGVTGAATVGGALGVTGAITGGSTITVPKLTIVSETTTARVCTAADYGKLILISSNAAVAVTLPANGAAAGSWIAFAVIGTDDCAPTISAATADTLIGPNDIDLDSVAWGTGHRINGFARFWSDGSKWHAQNLGGTTMTYTD